MYPIETLKQRTFLFPGENKNPKRKGRHFLAILGYLHGFKIGQDIALQYPPFLVSPVIILPPTNQQQSINIQQSNADENYQENLGNIQSIKPAKLISNATISKENDIEIIYAPKRKVPQIHKSKYEDELANITVRQNVVLNNNDTSTVNKNDTDTDDEEAVNNTTLANVEEIFETTTKPKGPYVSPTYNNEAISSLTLTTVSDEEQQLPSVTDIRWQNFKGNLSTIMSDDNVTENIELNNTTALNFTTTSTEVVTESSKEIVTYTNGPYPNRLYNNAMIDQVSLTTNYYTTKDLSDGWSSSVNELTGSKSSGFKPLAGLYYDGFLQRPLKKFGFIPQNFWYQNPYHE